MTLTLTNRLSDLARAQDAASQLIAEHAIDDQAAYALRLAIEELGSNVIRHAYTGDQIHQIQMTLGVSQQEIELTIEDDGRPFDPTGGHELPTPGSLEEAPTGGMGLSLVSSVASRLSYERIGGRNRSTVHIDRAADKQ